MREQIAAALVVAVLSGSSPAHARESTAHPAVEQQPASDVLSEEQHPTADSAPQPFIQSNHQKWQSAHPHRKFWIAVVPLIATATYLIVAAIVAGQGK